MLCLAPPHRKGRKFTSPDANADKEETVEAGDAVRWKLLVIASLAAVVAGAGGSAGLLHLLAGRARPNGGARWFVLAPLLLPLAAITYASVFVYRHTARRRKLQAAATALLSLALTLAVYLAFAVFTTCCAPPQAPPAPTPVNVS